MMKTKRETAKVLCGALAILLVQPCTLTASPENSQYIVSGYPPANPRSSKRSAAIAIETGANAKVSGANALEARYRTTSPSVGRALRSDKSRGMVIYL